MKAPRLDPAAATEFAVRHGEKIVVGIVGIVAFMLLWGGVDAVRSLSVKESHKPQALERAAAQAQTHIGREPRPPADLLPPRTPIADAIDPWRPPLVPWKSGSAGTLAIATPPSLAVLDNPLFKEAAKRTKPEVLPVEDLRAVAGLAVVPAVAATDVKPRPPRPEVENGAGSRGRVVPYVVVTGLIPVARQQAEYRRRFESCGFRDEKRDSPLWCDFEIDRGTVDKDGKETWTRIDLAAIAAQRAAPGNAAAVAGIPAEFQLGSGEDARSKQTTPIAFCSGLPQRLDGTWELADLHPWFVDRLKEGLEREAAQQNAPQPLPDAGQPGRDAPDFGGVEERPADQQVDEAHKETVEYRLFRFLDTAVQPGGTYRYRVRLKVWNPNFDKMPERMRPHLSDPKLALETKLASPDSQPTAAAVVPDTTRLLVAPLRRSEIKEMRLKPGTLEVLVLGPAAQAGTLALRGLVADPGAVVDIDERANLKNQRDRARGEKIATGRLLLDARGRQEDRRDGPAEREKPPGAIPEPLEVIGMRPDGSFEVATLADSERAVAAYADTLPRRSTKADAKEPAAGDVPGFDLPVDPLSRPGAGR